MELLKVEKAYCITCSGELKGRTDKKFCNEYCRNNFHNRLQAKRNNLVRNINNALGKNRRILEEIAGPEGYAANVPLQKLLNRGFRPVFYTHKAASRNGRQFKFCYDHGVHRQENGRCLVVKLAPQWY